MNDARLEYILDRLSTHFEIADVSVGAALCATAVEVLEVDGAGLSLHSVEGVPISVAASSDDMKFIHELERTLGEGPCVDAFLRGEPTGETDLSAPTTDAWPAFRAEAIRTRARAVFGYPLRVADGCVGALNIYKTRPGPLASRQHEDALLMAALSGHTVAAGLSLEQSDPEDRGIADAIRNQDDIHLATGMISVQLGLSIVDALARLRARAFADGRSASDVARDVVERRLRFTD